MNNNNKEKNNSFLPETINLFNIIKFYWRLKWLLLIFIFLSLIYSSYKIRNTVYEYEVKLTVVALEEQSNYSFASIQNINQILGIKNSNPSSNLNLYKTLIKSHYISDLISRDIEFMKKLAGESWDDINNSIVQDENGNQFNLRSFIKNILGIPTFKVEVTNSKFVFNILSNFKFKRLDSGMTEIYFKSKNPDISKDLLMRAHNATEAFLKKRNIDKTMQNIDFINTQLAKPIKSNNKTALIKMLVEQNQSLMISSSNIPYAAEAFTEPTISDFPVSPNSTLIIVFNILIFLFMFFIISVVLSIYSFNKKI